MEKAKRKNKPAINIIDVLIVLIILAAAAVLFYIFVVDGRGAVTTSQTHTIKYVIEARNIREEFSDNITVGEKVIDSVGMFPIGTIVAYEERNATTKTTNSITGESVMANYPGRKNMYITIEAQAYIENEMYSIDGYKISVGYAVGLKLPNFVGVGYCIKLDVLD